MTIVGVKLMLDIAVIAVRKVLQRSQLIRTLTIQPHQLVNDLEVHLVLGILCCRAIVSRPVVSLLSSQVKKAKVVNVLSAMHSIKPVSQDGSTKPAIIEFYNSTKFGVDRVDQMCRLYSSKAGGRRWPVNVFSNMIDMAGINSRTIFELASGNSISRRQFLLNLAEQLVESYRSSRSVSEPLPAISQQSEQRCKCHTCHKNKPEWPVANVKSLSVANAQSPFSAASVE